MSSTAPGPDQRGTAARRLRRARTLLLADEGKTDAEIAAALHIGSATVARTRQRFTGEGLEAALAERSSPGKAETQPPSKHLIALACSDPPQGKERRCGCWRIAWWSWAVEELSYETRRTLKK